MALFLSRLEERGDQFRLITHYDTAPYEAENGRRVRGNGNGMIRDGRGNAQARLSLSIPIFDEMMLINRNDQDYLEFSICGSKTALRRLLKRFPYWRVAEGGI